MKIISLLCCVLIATLTFAGPSIQSCIVNEDCVRDVCTSNHTLQIGIPLCLNGVCVDASTTLNCTCTNNECLLPCISSFVCPVPPPVCVNSSVLVTFNISCIAPDAVPLSGAGQFCVYTPVFTLCECASGACVPVTTTTTTTTTSTSAGTTSSSSTTGSVTSTTTGSAPCPPKPCPDVEKFFDQEDHRQQNHGHSSSPKNDEEEDEGEEEDNDDVITITVETFSVERDEIERGDYNRRNWGKSADRRHDGKGGKHQKKSELEGQEKKKKPKNLRVYDDEEERGRYRSYEKDYDSEREDEHREKNHQKKNKGGNHQQKEEQGGKGHRESKGHEKNKQGKQKVKQAEYKRKGDQRRRD